MIQPPGAEPPQVPTPAPGLPESSPSASTHAPTAYDAAHSPTAQPSHQTYASYPAPVAYPPPAYQPPHYPYMPFALAPSTPPIPFGLWMVLAAGVGAIVGSFLPWARVGVPIGGPIEASGVDLGDGCMSFVIGLALTVIAGVAINARRVTPASLVLATFCGLSLAGLALLDITHVKADQAEMLFGARNPNGSGEIPDPTSVNAGTGVMIVMAAGIVTLVGVIVAVSSRRPASRPASGP